MKIRWVMEREREEGGDELEFESFEDASHFQFSLER